MFEALLKKQVRNDPKIAGMLTAYKGKPAFFYQKSPADTNTGWQKPCYPRVDYNTDMRNDPERKTAGTLAVNIWCSAESAVMPEDIEKRFVELISGTFYTAHDRTTVCAVWSDSSSFDFESGRMQNNAKTPEIFGVTILYDLMQFPEQITTDPDPVQGLNEWTKVNFPAMTVIAHDEMMPVWKPSDANPAIYWRFEGTAATDRQSYAVNWYNGQFAAHIMTDSVTERNRWTKAIAELIQLEGEIVLTDGSPMFAKQISIRHNADPLRDGQLLLTGNYGVLAQQRKEYAQNPLNHANIKNDNLRLEVNISGKENR